MLEALAAIPPLQSAIRIDGEDSGCVRLQLDIYLDDPTKIVDLTALRGSELQITLRKTT